MMTDTTKTSWYEARDMTLTFIQGDSRRIKLVQLCCCKVA